MNEQQLAAVKQALEALEWHESVWAAYRYRSTETSLEAIAALQSIISQDALDKMAENARELGLDYEPAPVQEPVTGCACRWDHEDNRVVTCERHQGWLDVIAEWADRAREAEASLKATPPAAQPAVQEGRDWSLLEATQESLREHMAEIKRLKAAQPAQKPWVGLTDEEAQWIYDNGRTPAGMMEMVEAKLKEKNHV
jgi:hypothetical protein